MTCRRSQPAPNAAGKYRSRQVARVFLRLTRLYAQAALMSIDVSPASESRWFCRLGRQNCHIRTCRQVPTYRRNIGPVNMKSGPALSPARPHSLTSLGCACQTRSAAPCAAAARAAAAKSARARPPPDRPPPEPPGRPPPNPPGLPPPSHPDAVRARPWSRTWPWPAKPTVVRPMPAKRRHRRPWRTRRTRRPVPVPTAAPGSTRPPRPARPEHAKYYHKYYYDYNSCILNTVPISPPASPNTAPTGRAPVRTPSRLCRL